MHDAYRLFLHLKQLDRIHARYGADALTIGFKSKKLDQFGTKIAFTRVPELEEFEN